MKIYLKSQGKINESICNKAKSLTNIDHEGYWYCYNEEKYYECEEIKAFLDRVNRFAEELKTNDYQNVLMVKCLI